EGCSNRAFIFTFNNNWRLVAKLPFRVAGPAKLTTASEIACIKCLGTYPFKYLINKHSHLTDAGLERRCLNSHWKRVYHHRTCRRGVSLEEIVVHDSEPANPIYRGCVQAAEEGSQTELPAYGSIDFDDEHVKFYPTEALEDSF
ncbi:hypothetical protein N7507_011382, partial [Penicillium longicatenatum]